MRLAAAFFCLTLFAEDKPKPDDAKLSGVIGAKHEYRIIEVEALRLRVLELEMQALQAKYMELARQRAEVTAAICKRAGIEGCEVQADGVIAKRAEAKP